MEWLTIETIIKEITTTINGITLTNGILFLKGNNIMVQFDMYYENISLESIQSIWYYQKERPFDILTTIAFTTQTFNYVFTTTQSIEMFLLELQTNVLLEEKIHSLNDEYPCAYQIIIRGINQYLFLNEQSLFIPFGEKPYSKKRSDCYIIIETFGKNTMYKRMIICSENNRLYPHICYQSSLVLHLQFALYQWEIYQKVFDYEIDDIFIDCQSSGKDCRLKLKSKHTSKYSPLVKITIDETDSNDNNEIDTNDNHIDLENNESFNDHFNDFTVSNRDINEINEIENDIIIIDDDIL